MIIPVSKQLLEIFFISIRAMGYFNAVIVTFVCEIPTCLQNGFSSGPCGMPAASWTPMCMGSWVGIATSDDVNRRLVSSHPSCVLGRCAARIRAPTRFTKTLKCDLYPVPIQWSGCSWELGDIHKMNWYIFLKFRKVGRVQYAKSILNETANTFNKTFAG